MKKLLCLMCALLLISFSICSVGAENAPADETPAPMLPVGVVTPIESGALYDLDGDGVADDVQLALSDDAFPDDEYDEYSAYTLAVGDQSFSGEGCSLSNQLYALRLDEYSGTLLMVFDYGPSDDPYTSFYLYETGRLIPAGFIESNPADMRVNNGIITTPVRGRTLYTWYHDADFSLARAVAYDTNGEPIPVNPSMYPIPRYTYPMGLIVTLKVDLPLCASMNNPRVTANLPKGSQVVLCASDDVEWVYIESLNTYESGWLRLDGEYGLNCVISGESVDSQEVFDGLFLAD